MNKTGDVNRKDIPEDSPKQQGAIDKQASKPLRLLAQNSEDFRILSGLLQDSVLVPANVRWQKKANRFTMPLSRFCWELVEQSSSSFFRIASCLVVEGVERAQQRGFKKGAQAEVVNLLACELLATGDLRFTFSAEAELCLFGAREEATPLLARLTDIGEVQEAQSIPQHRL